MKTIYNYQIPRQSATLLATIQTPVQSHVHSTLSSPPLLSFQSQEQEPLQVSSPRYPPPEWYNSRDLNISSQIYSMPRQLNLTYQRETKQANTEKKGIFYNFWGSNNMSIVFASQISCKIQDLKRILWKRNS